MRAHPIDAWEDNPMTTDASPFATPLTQLLGCLYPIISAGTRGRREPSLQRPFPMPEGWVCSVWCASRLS